MPAASTRRVALATLTEQHAALRTMMARCEALADQLDAGRADPATLHREVARLRLALDRHNRHEEELHPMLLDADWMGAVRVARMIEDHVEEHRAMRRELGTGTAATWELRQVLASLRAHLEAEERHFLNARVLRDDLTA